MTWLISAILFIISLGLVICLHELGHFATAKMFKVYCHEFSIGFGPAILHVKKEGKETYFSIRAIPLGGYVSMYGEEDEEPEDGVVIPKERSIEGIKKWKKAIVVSAGVIVNAVLAIAIFAVKDLCFKDVNTENNIVKRETAFVNVQDGDEMKFISYYLPKEDGEETPVQPSNNYLQISRLYVIDDDITLHIGDNDIDYVLGFHLYSEKEDNSISKGLGLYKAVKNTETPGYENAINSRGETEFYIPDVSILYKGDAEFDATFSFIRKGEETPIQETAHLIVKGGEFEDIGISLKRVKEFAPFKVRWQRIWLDYSDAATSIFKGIGMLFTPGGVKNLSSIVGIFVASEEILATRTFAYYLYLWGFISVNLAIFNLLPFPGLDGWQLLVTAYEGITRRKVSTKFKAIMNIIGFVLLIGLMLTVVVMDIIRLV